MSIKNIDIELLKKLAAESFSLRSLADKLKIFNSGSNLTRLKKKINDNNIDITHFTGQSWSKGKTLLEDDRIKTSFNVDDGVFCENSKVPPSTIKKLIIKLILNFKIRRIKSMHMKLNLKINIMKHIYKHLLAKIRILLMIKLFMKSGLKQAVKMFMVRSINIELKY